METNDASFRPLEQLEAVIHQGAANLTAFEHGWLLAVAEFDRRSFRDSVKFRWLALGTVSQKDSQLRRKLREFLFPVPDQRRRHDQQRRGEGS